MEDDGGAGGALLIERPAGIGKTALLGELGRRAKAAGMRVLRARGSEMEREFGFGVVRQLFGPVLQGLSSAERARLFVGPAALAAAILGFGTGDDLEVTAAEASLYGLFWLLAGLAEFGPLVLAIDDAHRCDASSLRFVQSSTSAAASTGSRPLSPSPPPSFIPGCAGDECTQAPGAARRSRPRTAPGAAAPHRPTPR